MQRISRGQVPCPCLRHLSTPPATVCILRLSAIGDTCHVLPVVRTLQHAWPATRFTWIIGRVEAKLLGHIPDIEFIVVDKSSTLRACRTLRDAMRGRQFDVLMHMLLALRASMLSTSVPLSVAAKARGRYAASATTTPASDGASRAEGRRPPPNARFSLTEEELNLGDVA